MQLLKYLLGRIIYGGLVLVLVAIFISSLIYLGQVDPARLTFGQRADLETVESKREELGLNKSLSQQLTEYLLDLSPIRLMKTNNIDNQPYSFASILSFKSRTLIIKAPWLRQSYQTGRNVSAMISEALPLTIYLALSSFIIALIIGVSLGSISALNYDTNLDKFILATSSLGYSLPSYVIAMAIALIFAWYLNAYTGLNIQGSIYEIDELGNDVVNWKNLILPSIALGVRPLSVITQITRSSMLDVLSAPYVKTAKAKGLASAKILWSHVLANAKNPIGTASLGWLASLLTGAFFVETVFNYKGIGSLTVNALLSYDLPLILGCILCTSVIVILINIITDLFYKVTDPRV